MLNIWKKFPYFCCTKNIIKIDVITFISVKSSILTGFRSNFSVTLIKKLFIIFSISFFSVKSALFSAQVIIFFETNFRFRFLHYFLPRSLVINGLLLCLNVFVLACLFRINPPQTHYLHYLLSFPFCF